MKTTPKSAMFDGKPVTVRLANVLHHLEIKTLEDLADVIQDGSLKRSQNIGEKTMIEARCLLGDPEPPTVECHRCGHEHVCILGPREVKP